MLYTRLFPQSYLLIYFLCNCFNQDVQPRFLGCLAVCTCNSYCISGYIYRFLWLVIILSILFLHLLPHFYSWHLSSCANLFHFPAKQTLVLWLRMCIQIYSSHHYWEVVACCRIVFSLWPALETSFPSSSLFKQEILAHCTPTEILYLGYFT